MSLICDSRRVISAFRKSLRDSCAAFICCRTEIPDADDNEADDRAHAQDGNEGALALTPLFLAVRQQVDQDHCTNLRIARPQAVR